MHKEPNKKLIGLFMVTGIAVFLIILGFFLKSKIFSGNDRVVVMYFEESIKGLNVGSSVVFKGVEVGKVSKIDLIANANSLDFSIPVYAQMKSSSISANGTFGNKKAVLDALIDKGLRARLTTQSYLTGQLMIEFEMLPDTPIVIKNLNPDSGIVEIPTVLSPMGEISKGIQDIPFKQSVEKFNLFFDEMNKQIPVILPKISQTFTNINKVVTDNSRPSSDAIDNFNKAAINVGEAAKSLRNFADYMERHPEALLKGKGGY